MTLRHDMFTHHHHGFTPHLINQRRIDEMKIPTASIPPDKISKKEIAALRAVGDDMKADLPNRIKLAMENSGQSVGDIAQLMGVRDRTVADWRSSGMISKERLPLLARLLGVTIEWLMTGEGSNDLVREERNPKVVQFSSHNRSYRLVPRLAITEIVDTVNNDPDNWQAVLNTWQEQAEDFIDPIAITFNPQYDVGIPLFAQMCNVDWFEPWIPYGATIGWSPDIIPAPGSFCMFALKDEEDVWRHATGFWFPDSDMRFIPMDAQESFRRAKSFWLVADKHGRMSHQTRHDIHIKDAKQAKFIATKTWLQYTDSVTMTNALMGTTDNSRVQFESRILERDD